MATSTLTTSVLPRFLTLKSTYNNKYLRYLNGDTQANGFLQFSGEEVVSPFSKFQVEVSKTGKGLVHLRCCYNNKYWGRQSKTSYWILARADEKQENQSKWLCTLFEPIYIDANTIRFRHVQLGHYVCLWLLNSPFGSCAFAGRATVEGKLDAFTIIDWESLLILPKHVAFKLNKDNYLAARWIEHHPYLQFSSNDAGDPLVGNEIFTNNDGSVRIKNDHFGKFWRRSPNWIWADSDDTTAKDLDTVFMPVKVDNKVVALRNLANKNFCTSLSKEGKHNCLNADIGSIAKDARLEVEELVLSRNVYNVDFRLMDARIYGQKVISMANGDAINRSEKSNTIDLKLKYTESKSNTWDASVSLKLGVKTTLETGIPRLVGGQVEISAEFNAGYDWGKTETTTSELETVYQVVVPPMTMVKVSLVATQGSCDVPFSYSQRDTLYNGQQIISHMDDGVYTGINSYNFKYETKQEAL